LSSTPQPAPGLASRLDLEVITMGGLGAERAEWVARDEGGNVLRRFREFTAANAGPVVETGCRLHLIWEDTFGLRLTSWNLVFGQAEPNGLFTPLFDQAHTADEPREANLTRRAEIEIGPLANLGSFRWRLRLVLEPLPIDPLPPPLPGQPAILPSPVPAGVVDVGN
jgi:hypothetical protein